jgi:uncharacterized protein (DUF2252 family)
MDRNIAEQIREFNMSREKDILPLKYKAMAENPFSFFRGTCHLFYPDVIKDYPFTSSPLAWICGDLHVENVGSFKGANRQVYFDISDFDETIKAPVLWDILRLTTSVELAGSQLGFTTKDKRKQIAVLLKQYRFQLIQQKATAIEKTTSKGLVKKLFHKVALRKTNNLLQERTKQGKLIINDRLLALHKEEKKSLIKNFTGWYKKNISPDFAVQDVGFRIAGTGSLGVNRYIFLASLGGEKKKTHLLDVKEAVESSATTYIKKKQDVWPNQASRVVDTQELLQHVAPAFLSTFQHENKWFIVKELQPTEDKISLKGMMDQPENLEMYMKDLGMIVASAHLRGSGRRGAASADELKVFAESPGWMEEVTDWAIEYTRQVKKDYVSFCKAYKQGYFGDNEH